jgi:hypothetical protein
MPIFSGPLPNGPGFPSPDKQPCAIALSPLCTNPPFGDPTRWIPIFRYELLAAPGHMKMYLCNACRYSTLREEEDYCEDIDASTLVPDRSVGHADFQRTVAQ